MDTREDESQAFTLPVINPSDPLYLYPLEEDKHQNSHDPLSRPTDSHPDHHHPSTGTFAKTREDLSEQAIAEELKPRSAIVEEWLRATEGEGNDGEDLSSHQTHKDIPTWDDDENFSNQLLFVLPRDGESGESGGVEQEKNTETTKIFSHRNRSRQKKAEGEIITLEQICRAPWALSDVPDAEAVPLAVARPYSIKIHSLNRQGDEFTESTNPMSGRIESCQSPEGEKGGSLPGSQDLPDSDKEDEKKGGGLKKVEFNIPLLTAQLQSQGEQQSETSHMTPSPIINTNRTKAGSSSPSIHRKRYSRSPVATNIMREIRKMSLASQDAREERKKASKAASATEGTSATAAAAPAPGTSSNPSGHSGDSQNAKRTAKRLSRRRKRREEEYTDKDRAAAVTLGSRDIKQSLKAKKKRERKLHISIDLLHSEEFLSSMLFCEAAYQMRVKQEPKSAIITLNKALDLQPAHKGALVARSQCHLKLGDATSALKDAQTSFKGNDTFIMGLYQCAEALYNLGQFEKALIAYHRGYRLRKLENFRIGIQKSQEAIRRAIGDTSATRMEDLDNILPLIDHLDAFKSTGKSSYSAEDRRILDSLEGSSSTGIDTADRSTPNTTTASVTNNGSSLNSQNSTPITAPIPSGGTGRTSPARTSSHQPDHLSPLPKEPNLPIIPVAIKLHPSTAPSQASKSKEKWVAREVLGQMYFDKDYLIKFLHRPDVQRGHGASEELRSYAAEALNYLEIREGFWRQQNPMYARKQATSTLSKSGSSPLEENPTNKSRHISGGNCRALAINPSRSPASSSTSPSSTNAITSTNLLKGKENIIGKTG